MTNCLPPNQDILTVGFRWQTTFKNDQRLFVMNPQILHWFYQVVDLRVFALGLYPRFPWLYYIYTNLKVRNTVIFVHMICVCIYYFFTHALIFRYFVLFPAYKDHQKKFRRNPPKNGCWAQIGLNGRGHIERASTLGPSGAGCWRGFP